MDNSVTYIIILRINVISVGFSFSANQKFDFISFSSLSINKIVIYVWCFCFFIEFSPALNQVLKLTFNSLHSALNSPPPSLWRCGPTRAMTSSFLRFLDHTRRRSTVIRTPLDAWSVRRRDPTWQHTTLTTDRHPCPRWDSKPQSQQASGRRPTP